MASPRTIPTPIKYRWQRFRYRFAPVIGFVVCLAGVVVLWHREGRRGNSVGEVETVRVEVSSGSAGTLTALPRGNWTLFDVVELGDIIARLDDKRARASLATLDTQLTQIRAQLEATKSEIHFEYSIRAEERKVERSRAAITATGRFLEVIEHQRQVAVDKVEKQRIETDLSFFTKLVDRSVVSEQKYQSVLGELKVINKRIEAGKAAAISAYKEQKIAEKRLAEFPTEMAMADEERLLGPILGQLEVQRSRINELNLEIDGLAVRAPISGVISMIHFWPGQSIQPGQAIVTIAADHGRYIVGYVRQAQRIRPEVGMRVDIRGKIHGSVLEVSEIERVGPQVEPVPEHQLMDPGRPEWGWPVRITLPPQSNYSPGELVDITYWPDR